MTLNSTQPMTADTFAAFLKQRADGHQLWELVQGQPVRRSNTREQGMIVSLIIYLLYNHTHKRHQVGTSIWHHQAGDLYNVRMPNIAYYASNARPPVKEGFAPVYPDLAIDVKAVDEDETTVTDRGLFYLTRGTKMVWLVYPDQKIIDVMTHNDVQTLMRTDILTGGDVLPRFSLPVAEVFPTRSF
jgi:Uma2 family endonuclease